MRYTDGVRKIFLLIALFVVAIPAFARDGWDDNRRMAVTVRIVTPLFWAIILDGFALDVGFEYAPIRRASIRGNFRLIAFEEMGARLWRPRFNLDGRWYPQGNYLRGAFLGAGLQFNVWDRSSLSAFASAGYKAVFGSNERRAAFVLEPALKFGWLLFPADLRGGADWGESGLLFGLPLGVAF